MVVFVRCAAGDAALVARPTEGGGIGVEIVAADSSAALARCAGNAGQALLKDAAAVRARIERRAPIPGPGSKVTGPFRLVAGERVSYSLPVPPQSRTAVVTVAPAGELPVQALFYSASVAGEAGELTYEEAAYARQYFLVVIAQFVLGEAPVRMRAASDAEGAEASRHRSVNVDLAADPVDWSGMEGPVPAGGYALVNLELPSQCDQFCLFCEKRREGSGPELPDPEGLSRRVEDLLDRLAAFAADAGRVDVSLGGKDCLGSPVLVQVLRGVRGVRGIGLMNLVTPGTRLALPGMVAQLSRAGVDRVTVTLLGPDAPLHDAVAGRPGAFSDLVSGVRLFVAAEGEVEWNTVVVKRNLAHLADTLSAARSLAGSGEWRGGRVLCYVADPGATLKTFRQCCPRHADVGQALAEGEARLSGLVRSVHYVPWCVLPRWALALAGHSRRTNQDVPAETPEACRACPAFTRGCPSVGKLYLAEHGADELRPLPAPQ
jgi:hypothetical protein